MLDPIKITYSLSKALISTVINLLKINIINNSISGLFVSRKDGMVINPLLVCSATKSNMYVSCITMGVSCSIMCGIGNQENYFLVTEGIFKVTPEGIYYIT